ncbi:uncharacterized protein LOC130727476 isoform X2 [Lotus japonicus]|uniref:uncharacterized protein LOC130727476 isoform X2 n=1 Tax=Lotus japonicus TaxID=34305 RepID=UPI0025856C0E|nr:uncharacterized protein LOC130727476 isoform X2 [Lotus japonicus]
MASISGSQSGGKMVRPRRTARTGTPYARPAAAPAQPRSPNWLSRLVISPTRFIASGAGKILSTVLDLESSPDSSSSATSSPSSSSTDSTSEEVGPLDDENDNTFEGDDDALNKGLQPLDGNEKSKHVIEQLLMQESFSREEGDRLIKIIRSRVVDSPTVNGDVDKRTSDMAIRTLATSPDLSSAAVMEAKKWLQQKKSGIDSNSDLGHGSRSLNLVSSPQAPNGEGSPVDVAKLYMRARPPWASPSVDHNKPPTLSGIQLFKEETPHLFSGNSTSSSKLKRGSPATGSWSIQDEIRRVRSRATEEMLRTPSSKIDWSTFSMEHKNDVNSSAIENLGTSLGENAHNFTNLVDASASLATGLGSQAPSDLQNKMDGLQPKYVQADHPANFNSEQNQVSVAVEQTKGTQEDCREVTTSGLRDGSSDDLHRDSGLLKVNGISDTNGSNHQLHSVEETGEAHYHQKDPDLHRFGSATYKRRPRSTTSATESNDSAPASITSPTLDPPLVDLPISLRKALNSRLQDGNCLAFKEKVEAEDAVANGFSSFHAGQVIEENTKTLDNKPSAVDASQERTTEGVLEQEDCKQSMEMPGVVVNDPVAVKDDSTATGSQSQNSSSVQNEVQQKGSQATPTSIANRKGKRITRSTRKDRSRGVK